LLESVQPADPGGDDHSAATRIGAQLARVTERVGGGAEAELGDTVLAPCLLRSEVLGRIEVADLARERDRQVGRIEALDPARARSTRAQLLPERCRVV